MKEDDFCTYFQNKITLFVFLFNIVIFETLIVILNYYKVVDYYYYYCLLVSGISLINYIILHIIKKRDDVIKWKVSVNDNNTVNIHFMFIIKLVFFF